MANSFNFADIWARKQQDIFLKKSVAMIVADTSFNSALSYGKTLKRNYSSVASTDVPSITTRGSDMSVTDISDTTETLTINREFTKAFQVHDYDELQSSYGLAMTYGEQYGIIMQTQMDADILGEVVNAQSVVDDGTLGGTSGNGIVADNSNIIKILTAINKKLQKVNVVETNLVGIISPELAELVTQYYAAKYTPLGDNASENGFIAKLNGVELYVSNNLTGKATLALATQPTDGDTVTIQGVTFTFKTTLGSTPGNVLIGDNADTANTNLAALINAPQTTTTEGVALSTANSDKFRARATAVADTTGNTLTVTYKGASVLVVSETLTAAADVWTAALQKQLNFFGVKNKMTTLITQKKPSIETTRIPLQFGNYIKNGMLYGIKSFNDNTQRGVRVEIKSSAF